MIIESIEINQVVSIFSVCRSVDLDIYLEQNIQTIDIIQHTFNSLDIICLQGLKSQCLFLFIYFQQSRSLIIAQVMSMEQ